jgi:hypothetical protein
MVRERGLEPPRVLPHKILSLARLPVPPLPHRLTRFLVSELWNRRFGIQRILHQLRTVLRILHATHCGQHLPLVHDVVTIEYCACFLSGNFHCSFLWHSSLDQVADRRAAKIVNSQIARTIVRALFALLPDAKPGSVASFFSLATEAFPVEYRTVFVLHVLQHDDQFIRQ